MFFFINVCFEFFCLIFFVSFSDIDFFHSQIMGDWFHVSALFSEPSNFCSMDISNQVECRDHVRLTKEKKFVEELIAVCWNFWLSLNFEKIYFLIWILFSGSQEDLSVWNALWNSKWKKAFVSECKTIIGRTEFEWRIFHWFSKTKEIYWGCC